MCIELELISKKLPVKSDQLFKEFDRIEETCSTFIADLDEKFFEVKFDEIEELNLEKIKFESEYAAQV